MYYLGIEGKAFLLVPKWHFLPGQNASKMGREDSNMQGVRDLSSYVIHHLGWGIS
jgi:hypothetical protein